eukprot:3450139-Prymnesium_polylepis.2
MLSSSACATNLEGATPGCDGGKSAHRKKAPTSSSFPVTRRPSRGNLKPTTSRRDVSLPISSSAMTKRMTNNGLRPVSDLMASRCCRCSGDPQLMMPNSSSELSAWLETSMRLD